MTKYFIVPEEAITKAAMKLGCDGPYQEPGDELRAACKPFEPRQFTDEELAKAWLIFRETNTNDARVRLRAARAKENQHG